MSPQDSRLTWYIQKLEELSRNPKQKEVGGLKRDDFLDFIELVFGPILDERGNPIFPEDSRYPSYAVSHLVEIVGLEQYLETRNVPLEIIHAAPQAEQTRDKNIKQQAQAKVNSFIKQQEQLAIRTNAADFARAEETITQQIKNTINTAVPQLTEEPAGKLAKGIEEELLVTCFESPRQTLTPQAYEELVDLTLLRIDLICEENEIPLSDEEKTTLKENLKTDLVRTALPEASVLTQYDFKLPREFQEKLPAQGTTTISALTHPVDLVQRTNPPEVFWRATQDSQKAEEKSLNREFNTALAGTTSKELKDSASLLEKELGANHPWTRIVNILAERQERYEQRNPRVAKISQRESGFKRNLGQSPSITARDERSPLPSTRPVTGIHKVFNRIGVATRFYRVASKFPGIKTLTPGPIPGVSLISNFIYQKAFQPLASKFAQTTIGKALQVGAKKAIEQGSLQAIKTGAKGIVTKVSTWITAKLALAAFPEPVITKALLALSLAWDFVKGHLQKLKPLIKKLSLVLLGGIFLLTGLALGLPAGLVFFGISGVLLGAALLGPAALGGVTAGLGAFLGSVPLAISSLFSSFLTLPSSGAPIGALVAGLFGGLSILTFFVVMMTAGAFITPTGKGQGTGVSPFAAIPARTGSDKHLAEQAVFTLAGCNIDAINSSTWQQTKDCLLNSNLPNKEEVIKQLEYSISPSVDNCECLQCVGFVRGVMTALGRDPGGGRDAKDYLNPALPTPTGYLPPNIDMNEVQEGDLVIRKGSSYGHIGIVVGRDGNKILVAQAWGDQHGLVNITPYHYTQFDGFLRPQ